MTRRIASSRSVPSDRIDYLLAPTDDSWARDTGPIFVKNADGALKVLGLAFDGWGKSAPYGYDRLLAQKIAEQRGFEYVNAQGLVLEGGSFEMDGAGTFLATRSSVVSGARNPDMNVEEVEKLLRSYLPIGQFIWLEGSVGEDITDAHIDGFAR